MAALDRVAEDRGQSVSLIIEEALRKHLLTDVSQ
ncbi:ribbon-helix-helix protein, CopG family [Rhizobium gallicum]